MPLVTGGVTGLLGSWIVARVFDSWRVVDVATPLPDSADICSS